MPVSIQRYLLCFLGLWILSACSRSGPDELALSGIEPSTVSSHVSTQATVIGVYLVTQVHVDLSSNSPASNHSAFRVFVGDTEISSMYVSQRTTEEIDIVIPQGLSPGVHPVSVVGPSGQEAILQEALTVVDCPEGTEGCSASATSSTLRFDNSGIDEDLINVPVLVTLSPTNFDYEKADSLGADLRFLDEDGSTVLAHEIDEWNIDGTSQIWVLVPQIDASSTDDFILLTYGDLALGAGEDAASVWGAYQAVWHLQETGDGTDDEFVDSTGNTHHGQGGAGVDSLVPTVVSGKVGRGQRFSGENDMIKVSPSGSFIFPMGPFVISYWLSFDPTEEFMVTLAKGGDMGGFRAAVEPDGRMSWELSGSKQKSSTRVTSGDFHHVAFHWDGSTMRIYIDGSLDGEKAELGPMNSTAAELYIGRVDLAGIMDEVRVIGVNLSSSWIAAQYRSAKNTYISYE